MNKANKTELMKKIKDEVFELKNSPLYEYRISNNFFPVIGDGDHNADIIFIGEAPGRNEAKTGRPFCGSAGKILDDLLKSIDILRENVYITNIVKDRPPENRDPNKEEIALYTPYLLRQIDIIEPKVIATLGRYAMEYIMGVYELGEYVVPISQAHGEKHKAKTKWGDMYIIPLYHPAVAVYDRKKIDILKEDFKNIKHLI